MPHRQLPSAIQCEAFGGVALCEKANLQAEVVRLREAWRWLAWLDGDRRDDGEREMVGTPYQAAQRIAARLYEAERNG